jgi:hypothetical protein
MFDLELSSEKAYDIEYEFYQKSVVLQSDRDVVISGAHMGSVHCTKPFVSQELVIISKELLKERANLYLHP